MNDQSKSIRTQAQRSEFREHSVPIYMTSGFVFDDSEQARALFSEEIKGQIYSRYSNPNTDEFVDKMIALEHAEDGVAVASGMSAMFSSIAAHLSHGEHIIASRSIFGSTHQLLTKVLPRWGITHTYVDIHSPDAWERSIQPNTKMFFCESPSNPGLALLDLEILGTLANKHGILLNVDNCFATPIVQKPMDLGAHLVTHSATKFIDGQGRSLGGVIVGKAEAIQPIRFFTRHTGPALSPFNGWLLSKSLETLEIRMERHCNSALWLSTQLESHKKIERLKYPFLPTHPQYELAKKQMALGGGLFTIELKKGLIAGKTFLDSLQMISRSANLGDSRTIATHPASTTHSKLTPEERSQVEISDGLVRISVGLESKEDILQDILQALDQVES
jgi:O-succinylhomoserine sulfhydrylase